jgi:hypothetical protein
MMASVTSALRRALHHREKERERIDRQSLGRAAAHGPLPGGIERLRRAVGALDGRILP